jgi:hypothetical protein
VLTALRSGRPRASRQGHVEALSDSCRVQPLVPRRHGQLWAGEDHCRREVQRIETGQFAGESQCGSMLSETLVDFDDPEDRPLLTYALVAATPALGPTARIVSTKPMRQMNQLSARLISSRTRWLPSSST